MRQQAGNAQNSPRNLAFPAGQRIWLKQSGILKVDTVVIGLPNYLHKKAALLAAEAGKAVLCTKPLAMSGSEALEMLQAVERAGVFHGYLEDLVYTPKTLKAMQAAQKGALGKVLWARSRETHGGPHSDWFWTELWGRRYRGYGVPLH
jgi:predicted dehydrogenase